MPTETTTASSTEVESAVKLEHQLMTVAEVADELRLSYNTVLGLLSPNRHVSLRLKSVRFGRAYRIRRDWLTEFVNR